MNPLIFVIQLLLVIFLIWLLWHWGRFYAGALKAPDETARCIKLMRIVLPIALVGIICQIIVILVLMLKPLLQG